MIYPSQTQAGNSGLNLKHCQLHWQGATLAEQGITRTQRDHKRAETIMRDTMVLAAAVTWAVGKLEYLPGSFRWSPYCSGSWNTQAQQDPSSSAGPLSLGQYLRVQQVSQVDLSWRGSLQSISTSNGRCAQLEVVTSWPRPWPQLGLLPVDDLCQLPASAWSQCLIAFPLLFFGLRRLPVQSPWLCQVFTRATGW